MQPALVVQDVPGLDDAALCEALAICGFDVAATRDRLSLAKRENWALIAVQVNKQPGLAGGLATAGYRLWMPAASAIEPDGVFLRHPVRMADIAVVLLACGYVPVSSEERGALFSNLGMLCGNDDAMVLELAQSMISANEQDLSKLRTACSLGVSPDAAFAVHRLKSVARMLACEALVSLCEQLEKRAESSPLDAEAAAVAVLLDAGFAAVNAMLRQHIQDHTW